MPMPTVNEKPNANGNDSNSDSKIALKLLNQSEHLKVIKRERRKKKWVKIIYS